MKLIKKASGSTILKLTKHDWVTIGKKSGWFKKEAKSYDSGLFVFTEGASFQTPSMGTVNVLSIDLETHLMSVRAEGREFIMDMDTYKEVDNVETYLASKREEIRRQEEERQRITQEREENMRRRHERQQLRVDRVADEDYFLLTGFIAAKGTITAQVPSDKVDEFEQQYREIKGRMPRDKSFEIADPNKKWYKQYRVHLPKAAVDTNLLGIIEKLGLDAKETKTQYDINDTYYVIRLLEMGFDIGKSSAGDVENIEKYIQDEYGDNAKNAFINGYMY